MSIGEEELDNHVADMIACSTDENLLPSNATPTCSETLKRFNEALQRFRIYALSYEALRRFIVALSYLTSSRFAGCTSVALTTEPRLLHTGTTQ